MPQAITLDAQTAEAIRAELPTISETTVLAVVAEVPEYTAALSGEIRTNIEQAVRMALAAFVRLAEDWKDTAPGTPHELAITAAYELGRGEARSGRTSDALLAAYRIGARVAWRELSAIMVERQLDAGALARLAELVFAYIDELSASSVAGHADERATTGRVRERYLEHLAKLLIGGASTPVLVEAATRADWEPPETLTAVLLPAAHSRRARSLLDQDTLVLSGDAADPALADDQILLVPGAGGPRRAALLRAVEDWTAVVGPARPWTMVRTSFDRALRARRVFGDQPHRPLDTEAHLAALLVSSDPDALADLRRRVLAPLSGLRAGPAERLTLTLRSWLLHQGRREDVAAHLMVHPQTVRYRMAQIRELYGDALNEPQTVLELTVALGTLPLELSDQ